MAGKMKPQADGTDIDGFLLELQHSRQYNKKGASWIHAVPPEVRDTLEKVRADFHAGKLFVSRRQIWESGVKLLGLQCSRSAFTNWFNAIKSNEAGG